MEDQILIVELLMGLIVVILFLAMAWFFYFNVVYRPDCLAVARMATPQEIQRQLYPEMEPPGNNDTTKHLDLRYRNSKDGCSSSDEDRYSGREKVAVDDISTGIQNQSGISNENSKDQSQTEGFSGIKYSSEDENSHNVYLGDTESTEEILTYFMSSDSKFNTKEGGKCEERDAAEESHTGKGRFEECDCEASGSNIDNIAGTSQDFNEIDKTVLENVGQCENSSKNFETVDNGKCNNEYNEENKSEVDAVNVANSEVERIDQ